MNVLIWIQQPVLAWTIPPSHVERLRATFPGFSFTNARDEHHVRDAIRDADVAFTWILKADMVADARRLRWVHSSAVAVGTLPLGELAARDIAVTNSRGIQSTAIAEHVIAMMLALSRGLVTIVRRQDARSWAQNDMIGDRSPWLVNGQRMGIIGLGTIGQAVAVRAAALGMDVVGVRRRPEQGAVPGVREVVGPARIPTVIASSDVLVLAAPWTGATDRLLDGEAIATMKRGAVVINVARGQLVDESALAAALEAGRLRGAALDVFADEPLAPSSPFWSLPNVIVSPHTSGFRADHWDAVIDLFEEQLRRFLDGRPLLNQVDCEAGY
jgi:phosphoglycerate dehydrogenase-like enzyme